MAFDEIQFPTRISYGSRGGPRFNTDIVVLDNGFEQRTGIWGDSSGLYNARYGIKSHTDLLDVLRFFYARNGMLRGFRYQDPLDHVATQQTLVIDGSNTVQLIVNYTSGSQTHRRTIRKPVASPAVTMRRNSAPFASFTLDLTTGIATFTSPDASGSIASSSSFDITAISLANPAVVTTSAANPFADNDRIKIADAATNGMVELPDGEYLINQLTTTTFELTGIDSTLFTAYDGTGATAVLPGISRTNPARIYDVGHGLSGTPIIYVSGVVGMIEINGLFAEIAVVDADRFTIAIDASAFTEYASGGTWEQFVQPGTDVMDWTGEFDVPVRFGSDQMQASVDAFDTGSIPDIPIVELFND